MTFSQTVTAVLENVRPIAQRQAARRQVVSLETIRRHTVRVLGTSAVNLVEPVVSAVRDALY